MLSGEWIWLAYWNEPSPTATFTTDLQKRRDVLFNPAGFPDVDAVQSKWAEVERELGEFVNSARNESLKKMIPLRSSRLSLAHLMQHVVNHSTYHRGQIAAMLRQLGSEPVATDFHVFLLEGR